MAARATKKGSDRQGSLPETTGGIGSYGHAEGRGRDRRRGSPVGGRVDGDGARAARKGGGVMLYRMTWRYPLQDITERSDGVLSEDDAYEQIALEMQMHRLTGWDVRQGSALSFVAIKGEHVRVCKIEATNIRELLAVSYPDRCEYRPRRFLDRTF